LDVGEVRERFAAKEEGKYLLVPLPD